MYIISHHKIKCNRVPSITTDKIIVAYLHFRLICSLFSPSSLSLLLPPASVRFTPVNAATRLTERCGTIQVLIATKKTTLWVVFSVAPPVGLEPTSCCNIGSVGATMRLPIAVLLPLLFPRCIAHRARSETSPCGFASQTELAARSAIRCKCNRLDGCWIVPTRGVLLYFKFNF